MKWQSSNISWSYRVEFKKSLSTFFVSYLLRCIIWVLNIKVMHFKLLSVINHTSSCLVWTLKVRGNFRITWISCFRWNSRSSHLPGLVMIISVPIPWKVFHRSGSSRVILMLPWRYAGSGPAAMEDGGGPLKFGFKSGRRKRVITAEVRRQEGGKCGGWKPAGTLTSDGLHASGSAAQSLFIHRGANNNPRVRDILSSSSGLFSRLRRDKKKKSSSSGSQRVNQPACGGSFRGLESCRRRWAGLLRGAVE